MSRPRDDIAELSGRLNALGNDLASTKEDFSVSRGRLRDAEQAIEELADYAVEVETALTKLIGQVGSTTPEMAVPGLNARVNNLANDLSNSHEELTQRVDDLIELVRARPVKPPRVARRVDQQEREELKVRWPYIVCATCGTAHGGTCPRIRRQRVHRAAGEETIETWFWPEGKWDLPDGALTAEDVFGTSHGPALDAALPVPAEANNS